MKTPLIASLLLCLCFSHNSFAWSSALSWPSSPSSPSMSTTLRCGTRLINIGDFQLDVRDKCGEPAVWQQRYGITGQELRDPGNTLESNRYEQIIIDEWIYNFGPRHFRQYLRFENGILREIRSLNYGR